MRPCRERAYGRHVRGRWYGARGNAGPCAFLLRFRIDSARAGGRSLYQGLASALWPSVRWIIRKPLWVVLLPFIAAALWLGGIYAGVQGASLRGARSKRCATLREAKL
jgi:hypothetical protein